MDTSLCSKLPLGERARSWECVWEWPNECKCESRSESESNNVSVCSGRERDYECVCVCVRMSVSVSVSVREQEWVWVTMCVCVCVRVPATVNSFPLHYSSHRVVQAVPKFLSPCAMMVFLCHQELCLKCYLTHLLINLGNDVRQIL